ncbi:DMT family transporter [Spirilliplanes yamanashiensis]|uniref:Transporter n=1 Tax=Spirilliplanes yamanashiensis TaxID=42233 RepID=A0A8J3Y6D1_9ACTN|nr:DMT family transporter [Spirilliplanes yamanashiensis]MDP9814488.1 drug/metabolite transporter (DMT)-like permease [Spirilliplanes yamanashiensis]GIJ02140.1 transporter [Spirilliplanes yamanashiensis]
MSTTAAAPSPSATDAAFPLFAVLSWGAMFPILSTALVTVDAFNLTAVRYLLAAGILVGILAWRESPAALRPAGRAGEVLVLGVLGFASFNLLTNLALGVASPQNVALFAATTPVITQFVRWARDGVRPSPLLVGLSAVAFAGVGLVLTRGRLDGLAAIGGGELVMLAAVVSWAIYAHGSSRFPAWSPLRYTALTSVAGTLAIVAAALVADLAGWQRLPAVADLGAVAPQLTYLVLVAAVAAVLAMNTGARRLGPANAALYMNLVPVVTFAVQIARGHRPLAVELAGAALTVAALVAANLTMRRPATPAPVAVDHLPISPAALMPRAPRLRSHPGIWS